MAVNLSKGGRINLSKREDGSAIGTTIFLGANWGMKEVKEVRKTSGFLGFGNKEQTVTVSKEAVDLDASVVMLGSDKKELETIYFGHKDSNDGSIHHSGDDLTGDDGGDDGLDNETISVNLSKVKPEVEYLVFILNSYRHHKFDEIPFMGLRIYTTSNNKPITTIHHNGGEILATYNLNNESNDQETTFADREAIVLGFCYKKDGEWKFKACGYTFNSTSIADIIRKDIPNII